MGSAPMSHTFVTVLRAPSSVRVSPTEAFVLGFEDVNGKSTVTVRTRYVSPQEGGDALPRELWFEVVNSGIDHRQAMAAAFSQASVLKSLISGAMNAYTDELQVERSFDGCDDHDDHAFFQNMLTDEVGLPRLTRRLDLEAFDGFCKALMAHPRRDRLMRGIAQYELAIKHWIPGQETLALAHLFMAMEALTPVAREIAIADAGGKEALMSKWGLNRRACSSCGVEYGDGELDANVRRRVLFQEDDDVYNEAKDASDGFEHGYLGYATVYAHAERNRDRLGVLARHAIMDLIATAGGWRDTLLTGPRDIPIPAVRIIKYLWATLSGPAHGLAPDGLHYPGFSMSSTLGSVTVAADGAVLAHPTETLTKQLGDGVELTDLNYEVIVPAPEAALLQWGPDDSPGS
jgi:hypothetical protein